MRTVFSYSRYIVVIAVVALLLSTLAVFVFGFVATVSTVFAVFRHGAYNAEGARLFSVELIEMIDLFLLGTILFITSVGMYELFVDPGMKAVLPHWMSVESLDELKFNLLAVIVVMLAVLFLGEAASYEFDTGEGMLRYGLAIAAVILAAGVTVYLFTKVHHMNEEIEERHAATAGEVEPSEE